MSKLRHPKKCYVHDIGFFSVPKGHRIIYPYISKWLTASTWTQDLIYYYVLYGLHFLDTQRQLEGSYKTGSVRPSVHPSACLDIGIVSLVFPKFWHGARNLYELVHGRAGFSGKKIFRQKLGKQTKNGPKTGYFEFFEKFWYLIFTEFVLQ